VQLDPVESGGFGAFRAASNAFDQGRDIVESEGAVG
jgi:hypothetical protein